MRHLAVFDMAARLHHLEPPNLAQGARGAAYGVLNCILNALFRRARDLDDPVNMVRHQSSSLAVTWPPVGFASPLITVRAPFLILAAASIFGRRHRKFLP